MNRSTIIRHLVEDHVVHGILAIPGTKRQDEDLELVATVLSHAWQKDFAAMHDYLADAVRSAQLRLTPEGWEDDAASANHSWTETL